MKSFISLLFAAVALAQAPPDPKPHVTVAFSPQPPALTQQSWGRVARRVESWQVIACNPGSQAIVIDSGWVYQSASQHIPTIAPTDVLRTLAVARQKHPIALAAQVLDISAMIAATLGASGAITVSKQVLGDLTLGSLLARQTSAALAADIPPDQAGRWVTDGLTGSITIPAYGCAQKVLFASRVKSAAAFTTTIGQ